MLKTVDVIIVGQGIAGTCLAFELYKQNKSFVIIDNSHQNCSSIVAAGIVNPIVFKRLTKSWNVDNLLPAMNDFYSFVEEKLQSKIVNPIEILKLFSSVLDQNQWIEKSDANGFDEYLGEALSRKEVENLYEIIAQFGGGLVKNSCYIDLPTFLKKSRSFFESMNSFLECQFDYAGIFERGDKICYSAAVDEIVAHYVVYCEGHKATENPFFKNLPFNLAKGEVVEFSHPTLKLDRIINKNGFIMPTKHNTFKLGATYEWKALNELPTDSGRDFLLEKLDLLQDKSVTITSHLAGIRPTVKDRRPLLGRSETNAKTFIFNGLGTKGALIAPFYAQQMADLIFDVKSIDDEVDIKRFSKIE